MDNTRLRERRKNERLLYGIFIMMYYIQRATHTHARATDVSNEPRERIVRDIEISLEFICYPGPIYSSTSVVRESSSLKRRKSRRQRTVGAPIDISSSYILSLSFFLACLGFSIVN